MKALLARAQRGVLEELAREKTLLGFDFDGTLAPLGKNPDKTRLPARTRALLARLARRYPCVVISGRSRADLVPRFRGIALVSIVGNHGLEPWGASAAVRRTVARWRKRLERELGGIDGAWIEDKTYSLTVHAGHGGARASARAAVARALRAADDVRLLASKEAVNVLPHAGVHKGVALERERVKRRCERAFFVGDDLSDEDVFLLDSEQLVTARVGRKRGSGARYFLRSRAEIDALLARLLELRPAPST